VNLPSEFTQCPPYTLRGGVDQKSSNPPLRVWGGVEWTKKALTHPTP